MNTTLILDRQHLRAASICAAKKDLRYYLNGVCVEVTASGVVYLVATDGCIMFVGQPPVDASSAHLGGQVIIPNDVIIKECKGKGPIVLAYNGIDWFLGDSRFTKIEGVYPDWRRIVPTKIETCQPASQFNSSLLNQCAKALIMWGAAKTEAGLYLQHNGQSAALMTGSGPQAFAVIMPLREGHVPQPFIPALVR